MFVVAGGPKPKLVKKIRNGSVFLQSSLLSGPPALSNLLYLMTYVSKKAAEGRSCYYAPNIFLFYCLRNGLLHHISTVSQTFFNYGQRDNFNG